MDSDPTAADADDHVPETEPDALSIARRLVRSARTATLATVGRDGAPNASYGAVATMPDGRPIVLVSRLSPHTRNLDRDPRCSLLFADAPPPPGEDPMTSPRVTLTGRMEVAEDGRARERFIRRNPKAELYADFGDFSFRTLAVESVHLVGGFARTARVRPRDFLVDSAVADQLAEMEAGAVEHMNADHADAVALYATRLAGKPAGDWRVVGIDPDGLDLFCEHDVARVAFPEPLAEPGALRRVLKDLADAARDGTSP